MENDYRKNNTKEYMMASLLLSEQFRRAVKGPWTTIGLAVEYNIMEYPDAIVVSFQGTCFPKNPYRFIDLLTDLDFRPNHFHPNGFYQAYLSYYKQIEKDLTYYPLNKKIVHMGFSLGGAMASMFCSYHPEHYGITFGAPHTEWGIKWKTNKRCIHYAIPNDPIVYLAPWWWGFYHPGKTVWLDWADTSILSAHMQYAQVIDKIEQEEDATILRMLLGGNPPMEKETLEKCKRILVGCTTKSKE